jgi:hypothetical protein
MPVRARAIVIASPEIVTERLVTVYAIMTMNAMAMPYMIGRAVRHMLHATAEGSHEEHQSKDKK